MSTPSCPRPCHEPHTGACVTCGHARTICRYCEQDIAASGADGGSWVLFAHTCQTTAPDVSPYVLRSVHEMLQAQNARLREDNTRLTQELAENEGVIAVWRGRTERAEAQVAALTKERDAHEAQVSRLEQDLVQCREWYGKRWNELEQWFRGPGKHLPIANQFWNILANGKADPTAPPTRYVLRATYEMLEAQVAALTKERDTAQANYQFMVNRAADEKLDGYRELGARAAHAEHEADRLREDYDDLRQRALVASEQRLDQIADLREALIMTQHTIGDLRNGFAQSVEPARWVEQLQGFINTVLDKTTPV